MKVCRMVFGLWLMMSVSACAGITEHRSGIQSDGQLYPCPDAPRCVSTQHPNPERQLDVLRLRDDSKEVWNTLIAVLEDLPRSEVVERDATYVRAEIISPWRFYTDDLELLKRQNGLDVDIRSTGRIGYYDFNVNRERVESLLKIWREAGVLAP